MYPTSPTTIIYRLVVRSVFQASSSPPPTGSTQGRGRDTYRRRLDDSDRLHDLLLIHLGPRAVEITHDGRHARLVAHCRRQVNGFLRVILGEATRQQRSDVCVRGRQSPPIPDTHAHTS